MPLEFRAKPFRIGIDAGSTGRQARASKPSPKPWEEMVYKERRRNCSHDKHMACSGECRAAVVPKNLSAPTTNPQEASGGTTLNPFQRRIPRNTRLL